ncbi:hypothetical protein [Youxingia wuxianensis]|uniref:Uncharacterized protein n=1 Tax=Youxingia wuxianensis TaxID=2763678 RepID=A0A926ET98_9FIRM|nr:hypothetical protein [Youxingia wuxianensis]MBC8586084.1 hypothetical protein [Youxingia wuxianensis]
MPREKEAYRDNLERLCEAFPDKEALTYIEIARFLGKSPTTIRRAFRDIYKQGIGITKATLARKLS